MSAGTATSLRDRQTEQVRAELRHRFVELVLERGLEGFTMQDVAAAAGVSVRTVYRYFPSREAMAEDLREQAQRSHDELDARRGSADWLANPEFFATTFESFDRRADVVRAARVMRQAGVDTGGTTERTAALRERLAASGRIDPASLEQLTGLLRLLGGTDAWLRLKEDDLDLDSRSAGHAVQWAMELLLEAAAGHAGPLRPRGVSL